MAVILEGVVPLFAVILLGYVAGRLRLFDEAGVATLVGFVFNLAMPPLLFRLMATSQLAEVADWRLLVAYFLAQLPVFLVSAGLGLWWFRQDAAAAAIQGFGSIFSNSVVLGLPLALSIYGQQGALPALMIITLDVILFGLLTLLLELARHRGGAPGGRLALATLVSMLRNPIFMATLGGLLYGLAGFGLAPVVDRSLGFVGQAGPPAALFALGATLSLRRLAGSLGAALSMVGFKLLIHPALTWLVVRHGFGLGVQWANVACLLAACPVGANTYVFARQYEAGVETSSSAILISTALAMLSLTGLILLLPAWPGTPVVQ